MNQKLLQVIKLIKEYKQEHLLANYEKMDSVAQERLLDSILNTNFDEIEQLYSNVGKKVEMKNEKIEPIKFIDKYNMDIDEKNECIEIGKKAIKEGKLAVITMAGGQGSRLGHDGPKGTYVLKNGIDKSIFEILTDIFKNAKKEYQVEIPWYIMTSEENNDETVKFFEKNNYFGYPSEKINFFKQGQLPMISTEGKILLNEEGQIKEAADGHGGIFTAMISEGIVDELKNKGVEWIFISGVDNIIVKPIDPLFIGLSIKKNVLAAGKSLVKRDPYEKVGVFCKKNGKPSVVEYTEISAEMANMRNKNGELVYGESHINCNMFNIKSIEQLSKKSLEYHIAFKKANYMDKNRDIIIAEKPNAYKFESFLFDAFSRLDDILILRVKREEEFAPIKNKEGEDSPETARKLYLDCIKKV